jgi:hypothetical protein
MGEMSEAHDQAVFSAIELSKGWTFRQSDDKDGEWLPVKRVPSTVHQDLIDNKR